MLPGCDDATREAAQMLDVVTLRERDCGRAGELLSSRHRAERKRFPLLPLTYEDPARCRDLVRNLLSYCRGVAAVDRRDGVVGFLTSFDSEPDPSSSLARYVPARCAMHLVQGHAIAADVDPGNTYLGMFARLAASAVDRGVTDFVVHAPIGDPAVESAFVSLGFGRMSIFAIRTLDPIDRASPPDVAVRLATPSDLDSVERLIDEESVFHAGSPVFRPYLRHETAASVRTELIDGLARIDRAYIVASRDGLDVGIICVQPSLGSPLYVPDDAAYIAATAVLPDARGTGVGAALLDAAFEWARNHGHRAACLHYSTANALSTAFWTGVGFIPVMVHLRRRLDERILTSRPS
jgi:GNAT superfamily N-acetyltransferase